jgi:hypothetical protein
MGREAYFVFPAIQRPSVYTPGSRRFLGGLKARRSSLRCLVASGGVKSLKSVGLKIDVSEAGFLLSAGAPRLGYRRKTAEEDLCDRRY